MNYKIRTNKYGTASDDDCHHNSSSEDNSPLP